MRVPKAHSKNLILVLLLQFLSKDKISIKKYRENMRFFDSSMDNGGSGKRKPKSGNPAS